MEPFEAHGETIEVAGPRQARVKSKSQQDTWYAVDLDAPACSCKGFQVRRSCRHLDAVLGLLHEDVAKRPDAVLFTLSTGRYKQDDPEAFAAAYLPVGITTSTPRFRLGYKLAANVKQAAPLGIRGEEDRERFEQLYRLRLDSFGPLFFTGMFTEIARKHGKPNLALLCFEDLTQAGEWCHRSMFARWWEHRTGVPVPELDVVRQETLL